MGRRIADKVNNFNAYVGTTSKDNRLLGVTDEVKLVSLENTSETINLAGMAGEFESPAVGQYKSMEIEIEFANASKEAMELAATDNMPLILRSAQEFIDDETMEKTLVNRVITVKGMTKSIDYGTLKKGAYGKPKIKKEVLYYKETFDGEIVTEIDKLNGKAIIGGIDVTKEILDFI